MTTQDRPNTTSRFAERATRRVTLLGFLLIFGSSATWGDTVYLNNGSSIDGVVLGTHEGHLILQIGNLGKMEIPEKDIVNVEKNARTGPVNKDRNKKRDKDEQKAIQEREKLKRGDKQKDGDVVDAEDEVIDPDLEEKIQELSYDLTRQRATIRTRAEKKLTGMGKVVVPYVLPVASNPSELTRIAAFRILKKNPDPRSVDASIQALSDDNRFVRKLAWETLQEVSGESWVFPWDDSATDREREKATTRWSEWWKDEKKRLEAEAKKKSSRS